MWYLYYTLNLSLHCILIYYQGDNYSPSYRVFSIIRLLYKYRVPERPALADIIAYFLAFLAISFLVYSVYLGYEPENSPSQYYCFLSFVYLAIRNLGTLPCT